MKKKVVWFSVGFGIIAVLVVAIAVLLSIDPPSDTDASASESSSVYLVEKDEDLLTDITVTNKKGSFKVEYSRDEFVIKELSDYERLTDNYNQIVQYVTSLAAKQTVEKNPKDLEKYGLNEPQSTVLANYSDGSTFELQVGDKGPDGESYYVKKADENAVYLLSDAKTARFLDSKLDYISTVLTTEDDFDTETVTDEDGEEEEQTVSPEINSFTIIRNDLDDPIVFVPTKSSYSNEELTSLECIYQLSSPFNANLDSDEGEEPVSLFYAISAEKVVAINITEEKYAKYGFKNPTMQLIMDAKKKKFSHTVTVGSAITNKKGEVLAYYCIIDDNDVVYRVAADDLTWLTLDVNDILSDYIINPVLDEVKSVTVTFEDETYTFNVSGTSGTDSSDTDDETESANEEVESTSDDTLEVKYNGKELDTDKFRNFYIFLNSLTSTSTVDEEPDGSPVMTITYKYRSKNRSSDVVELIPYGNNKVAISLNGDTHLVARSTYVDRAIENVEKLINNKEINTYW